MRQPYLKFQRKSKYLIYPKPEKIAEKSSKEECLFDYITLNIVFRFNKLSLLQRDFLAFFLFYSHCSVLMKLRPKPICNYLNMFCDYIVHEMKSFTGNNQFQRVCNPMGKIVEKEVCG